ncbi:MAG: hypothetical protein KDA21_05910 [Phycisphaerales bacterium]|nr:hypothetical protein [Phycisphaerales bacterium]
MNGSRMQSWMVVGVAGLAATLLVVSPVHAGKGKKGSNGFDSGVKLTVSKGSKNYNTSSSRDRGGSSRSNNDRGHSSGSRYSGHGSSSHGSSHGSSYRHNDHHDSHSSLSISIGTGYGYGYRYGYGYNSRYCAPSYSWRSGWYPSYSYGYPTRYGYGYDYAYGTPYSYSYPSTTVNTYVNEAPSGGYQVWQEEIRDGQVQSSQAVTEPEYPAYNPGPPTASAGAIARGEAEQQAVESAPLNVDLQRQLDDWHESGWHALGRRNFTEARDHFARLAGNETDRARGKVGFAVSSALLGREAAAVWAMRRAFVTEPDALGFVALTEEAAAVVGELQTTLAADAPTLPGSARADRWFMVAAVAYLHHDVAAARDAAAQARASGDDSTALANLEDLLAD